MYTETDINNIEFVFMCAREKTVTEEKALIELIKLKEKLLKTINDGNLRNEATNGARVEELDGHTEQPID